MQDRELIASAAGFHPWDAMAPDALSAILRRGPFRFSAETGCGGSTIVLSRAGSCHTAFAIQGAGQTITALRQYPGLQAERVSFVEGESQATLPAHQFSNELDFVLLDGPHAYPLPQIEFAYLFPHLRIGGWIALDDIQIPSVHELFRFLKKEPFVALEEVVVRTAFFRRLSVVDRGPDGWQHQGINRHTVLRYSWRDRLRRVLGR